MATIREYRKKIESLNLPEAARQAIETTGDRLLFLNKEQMLEGKRRDGKDISPSYLEDPYFDSVEDAVGYSDWKDEITPNPKRKRGVPNLYIDGTYHRSIWIEVTQTSINFKSYFQGANDIERKFTDQIYGLNKDMRTIYIEQRLRKEFMELIRKQLSRNK